MRHTDRTVKGRREGGCWAFLVVSGKESACRCRRRGLDPWAGKIPWRRKWQPTLVFLPGKSHGQRSLVGYSPCCCVQSLSHATPWTVAHQDSLSLTVSQSLLKLMSIESAMPSNHLILCHPPPPAFSHSQHQGFSNELVLHIRWPKYWSFSFSISPSNEYSGLIYFRID